MGISTNVYTVYGVRIDWDNELHQQIEELWDLNSEIPFESVIDYMNGEYMIFGIVLFDSGDFRYGEFNADTSIDISNLKEYRKEYIEKFEKIFPQFINLVNVQWKLECFTHFR